jgi:hypothetical protein
MRVDVTGAGADFPMRRRAQLSRRGRAIIAGKMVNRSLRVAGAFCAFVVLAQEPIRVNVQEVIVPVTVTDEKGRFVSNLQKSDFHIYDENKEQTIEYFSAEHSQPFVIGFLMDLSNANRSDWKNYQQAAEELVLTLLSGDKKYSGYLIGYGTELFRRRKRNAGIGRRSRALSTTRSTRPSRSGVWCRASRPSRGA